MNSILFRIVLSCGLVAGALTLGNRAEAMQVTPDQKQEILQHYERATRAYDIQKYSEAVDEYQKAYEIGGDPAMLYNVAQSFRLNGQASEALHAYRRYLQRSPNARNRLDVERKIAELERTLETRRKAAEAAAAARPPAQVAPPEPAAIPAAFPPPQVVTLPDEAPTNKLRVTGIVLASVGAAALGTAVVTGRLAAKKGDTLTSASMNGERFDPSVEKSGKTLNTVTIISAVAGGALALAGTLLMVFSGSPEAEAPVATIAPLLGGDGALGLTTAVTF